MVGIVIVSHGGLAREMLAATRSIVGPVEQMEAVSSDADETGDVRERIKNAIDLTEKGDGVLIVTDMFGGTPANVALSFHHEKVEVVTGANLPMVLKLATGRENRPLHELALFIREYGQKNITVASSLLQEPKR